MTEIIFRRSSEGTFVPITELVRCKNCRHWDKGHTEECTNLDSVCFRNGLCKPDWYCADGERKEGEQE